MVLASCLGAVLVGCDGEATDSTANEEEAIHPIVKTAEVGPVTMTVTADKNRITIAERLTLTIEVVAAHGVDVEMGEPGEQLNQFQIRGFENRPAEPVEGGRRWVRSYDLDIFLSGEYSIPEIVARFADRREDADPASTEEQAGVREGTIRTEPFTVEVTSLLEGEFDPTQFADIKGPVALPESGSRRRAIAAVAGVAAALAVAAVVIVLLLRRRKSAAALPIPVVPHEWAFGQLQHLVDEDLLGQGRVHEFYYRLSHIARVYIELRFGLMAPERTTEEFLTEVHRSDELRVDHKNLLGDFLQSCDLVKFARYQPTAPEIELAFDSARDFITQTAPAGPPAEAEAQTADRAA